MPIPHFTDGYFLPPGVHRCTMEEARARFATGSRSREGAWRRFILCLHRMYDLGLVPDSVLLDGSFVTGRVEAGDVDFAALVPPAVVREARSRATDEYQQQAIAIFLSTTEGPAGSLIRTLFGAHAFLVPDEKSLAIWARFFQRVKVDPTRDPADVLNNPPPAKGILRVELRGGDGGCIEAGSKSD